jgi:hypothetical protein
MQMDTNDPPTCGKGLAAHAPLPAKLAELTEAVADNLELHMQALDMTDDRSRREYDAYQSLVKAHRGAAWHLQSTASEMAGYRDLPMGRHDEKAMSDPKLGEAFERFVRREEELLALLQKRLEEDRSMLAAMREADGSES